MPVTKRSGYARLLKASKEAFPPASLSASAALPGPFLRSRQSFPGSLSIMADAEVPKKRTFRKFTYRGVDLEKLLELNTDELVLLFHARARRR